jgi:hypothetical protein
MLNLFPLEIEQQRKKIFQTDQFQECEALTVKSSNQTEALTNQIYTNCLTSEGYIQIFNEKKNRSFYVWGYPCDSPVGLLRNAKIVKLNVIQRKMLGLSSKEEGEKIELVIPKKPIKNLNVPFLGQLAIVLKPITNEKSLIPFANLRLEILQSLVHQVLNHEQEFVGKSDYTYRLIVETSLGCGVINENTRVSFSDQTRKMVALAQDILPEIFLRDLKYARLICVPSVNNEEAIDFPCLLPPRIYKLFEGKPIRIGVNENEFIFKANLGLHVKEECFHLNGTSRKKLGIEDNEKVIIQALSSQKINHLYSLKIKLSALKSSYLITFPQLDTACRSFLINLEICNKNQVIAFIIDEIIISGEILSFHSSEMSDILYGVFSSETELIIEKDENLKALIDESISENQKSLKSKEFRDFVSSTYANYIKKTFMLESYEKARADPQRHCPDKEKLESFTSAYLSIIRNHEYKKHLEQIQSRIEKLCQIQWTKSSDSHLENLLKEDETMQKLNEQLYQKIESYFYFADQKEKEACSIL